MPEQWTTRETCGLCGIPGARRCGRCGAVAYCGQNCQRKDWARHRLHCYPVMVRETEGRGRGLVAARDIKTGDLILQDTAVITVPGEADTWEAGKLIHDQVLKMKEKEREDFYKLTRMQKLLDISDTFISAAGDDTDNIKKAKLVSLYKEETAIFFNNDISGSGGSKSLYLNLALLNHSCSPNSSWSRAGEERRLELRALREVREGEELSVNYISVEGRFSDREERRERLSRGWDFLCDCELCRTGEEEDTKLEIRRIQAEMMELCDCALEDIDWSQLASHQLQVLKLVSSLSCAPLLLPRECQSLANLSQLARDSELLQHSLNIWKETVESRRVSLAVSQYQQAEALLSQWRPFREKKLKPLQEEIEQFLWLM